MYTLWYYYLYMGRKKKKVEEEEKKSLFSHIDEETVESIAAIIFIIVAVFFTLSPFGLAGLVGEKTFNGFEWLLGVGYFLLPLTLLFLGISFFKSRKRNVATPKIIGALIFLISSLGLLSIAGGEGGWLGSIIARPLVQLFDVWMGAIASVGIALISLILIFDSPFKWIFGKKNVEGEEDSEEAEYKTDPKIEEQVRKLEEAAAKEQERRDKEAAEAAAKSKLKIKKPSEDELNQKDSGLVFLTQAFSRNTPFTPPPLSLLNKDSGRPGVGDIKANANMIKRTLQNFGINVEMDEVSIGPSVTRYALKPAEGVKLAKIVALQKDLSLALAAHPLRIEAPIPGKSLVGIEIPNSTKSTVGLGTLLRAKEYETSEKPLLMALGKGISGQSMFTNLAKAPHMLIAGTTGSGKSVTIHALLTSLLFRNPPENLKFIMVDPKRVELTLYNGTPHLLTPVITEAKKAILALKWAAREMDRRYDLLEKCKVRDISSYHENIVEPAYKKGGDTMPEKMPYIVFVIDELADIMQTYPKELEAGIVRLAQMSRAVGIHLILSTQRPSVNVITGLIKANVPSRLALQVASQIDSRTILDMPGAEKLLGAGDMLFLSGDVGQPSRVQSAFITETEVKGVVDYLINQYKDEIPQAEIDFKAEQEKGNAAFGNLTGNGYEDEDHDDLYEDAKQTVIDAGKASTSYIQRKLRVGYARAARLIDMLEDRGIVGPADGAKPREILAGGDDGSRGDEYPDMDDVDNNQNDDNEEYDDNQTDDDNSSRNKYENS